MEKGFEEMIMDTDIRCAVDGDKESVFRQVPDFIVEKMKSTYKVGYLDGLQLSADHYVPVCNEVIENAKGSAGEMSSLIGAVIMSLELNLQQDGSINIREQYAKILLASLKEASGKLEEITKGN